MKHLVFLLLFLTSLTPVAVAEPATDNAAKGLAIVMEAEQRDQGFGDYTAQMRMVLRNRHGEESERRIRVMVIETPDDGDKSLSIFDTPADVKGTAFLTYAHKQEDDDQWLYLPALKRVKRIAARNKSGSFMGSEFAYEDIAGRVAEKYDYLWLRNEALAGAECFLLEEYPKDTENSGYTKLVTWLDQEHYQLRKVDYYDRKGALLKTLTVSGYQQYQDKYWRPGEMLMVNHQTGKSTSLYWSEYQFKQGLQESDFSKNSLNRAR